MTVGELITQLSKYDMNTHVVLSDWDYSDKVNRFVYAKTARKEYVGSKTPDIPDIEVIYIYPGDWFSPDEL